MLLVLLFLLPISAGISPLKFRWSKTNNAILIKKKDPVELEPVVIDVLKHSHGKSFLVASLPMKNFFTPDKKGYY